MQKIFKYIQYLLVGFLLIGAILDTVGNSIDIFSKRGSLIGIIITLLIWSGLEVFLRFKTIKWKIPNGKYVIIKKFNFQTRLFFVGIIIPLLIPLLVTKKESIEKSEIVEKKNLKFSNSRAFKILILPFYFREDCEIISTDFEKTLEDRINRMIADENLNIEVLLDTSYGNVRDAEKAKECGIRGKADLVIWGDFYEKCDSKNNKAAIQYLVLNKAPLLNLGRQGTSGIKNVDDLSKIFEGYLQNDIDYILYWSLGLYALGEYDCEKLKYYFNEVNSLVENPIDTIDVSKFYSMCNTINHLSLYSADSTLPQKLNMTSYISWKNDDGIFTHINLSYIKEYEGEIAETKYLLEEANYFMFSNMVDSSIERYSKAISLFPFDPFLYNNRGVANMKKGKLYDAIDDFNTAIHIDSSIHVFYNNRASAYYDIDDINSAEEDMKKLFKIKETSKKNINKIIRNFRKHPVDSDLFMYNYGIILNSLGKKRMAQKLFLASYEFSGRNPLALINLFHSFKNIKQIKNWLNKNAGKRVLRANTIFDYSYSKNTPDGLGPTRFFRDETSGNIYIGQSYFLANIINNSHSIIESNLKTMDSKKSNFIMALINLHSSSYDNAIKYFNSSFEETDCMRDKFIGYCNLNKAEYEKANIHFDAYLKCVKKDDFIKLHKLFSQSNIKDVNNDDIKNELLELSKNESNKISSNALDILSIMEIQATNLDKAVEYADASRALDRYGFTSFLVKSMAAIRNKDIAEGVRFAYSAHRMNPDNPHPSYLLGVFYKYTGEKSLTEKSLMHFNVAISKYPDVLPGYYFERGDLLLSAFDDRVDQSIIDFDSAISMQQDYEYAILYKGIALERKGNYQEAREAFEKVLEINPKNETALNFIEKIKSK